MCYKNPLNDKIYLKRTKKRTTDIRGDYFRDQTAIIHSRPFRRLKNKTQVFFAPKDDHVCTRIEHVFHVATIAGTICRGLNNTNLYNLDVDMAFAIGLGHDIGHAPFGHTGEQAINKFFKDKLKIPFKHEINSYRVIEKLANNGKGLNLTYAVLDGIISHCGEKFERSFTPDKNLKDFDKIIDLKHYPNTFEGCIVRHSDKIAYLGRDIEDALVANFFKKNDIPKSISEIIGSSNGEIINCLVLDIINNSKEGKIQFSEEYTSIMKELYTFNKNNIYANPIINKYRDYCENIIKVICKHLEDLFTNYEFNFNSYFKSDLNLDKLFGRYLKAMQRFYDKEKESIGYTHEQLKIRIVIDYVAGMSDVYALDCMKELSIPKPIEFVHINAKKDVKDVKRY